jgi:preprotein translocase subunit SecY
LDSQTGAVIFYELQVLWASKILLFVTSCLVTIDRSGCDSYQHASMALSHRISYVIFTMELHEFSQFKLGLLPYISKEDIMKWFK